MASKVDHVDELVSGISSEILTFLKDHPSLKYDKEIKKIKCDLSGHEVPCKLEALKSYTEGKKYQKLRRQEEFNFQKYEPHIVQSVKKSHEHQLFCKLTLRHLNRIPSHVEKHVSGRRYKKALEKYEECQRLGIKFVSPSRQKRFAGFGAGESEGEEKKFSTNPEESGEESEAESVDSFSDLYPAQDFVMGEDGEGEAEDHDEEDVENMDVDTPNNAGDATGRQRKQEQKRSHAGDDDDSEDDEETAQTHTGQTHTNAGKKFKKGNPKKWKGKQKQQQQQGQSSKTEQSNTRTRKGKKKKKPRIM